MKQIKDILNTNISQMNKCSWHYEFIKSWPTIARGLEEHLSIGKIYKDTVVLEVHDNSWMQEVHLLSPVILNRIQQFYPEIQKIKVSKSHQKRLDIKKQNFVYNKITEQEKNVVKIIKDKDLAKALLNYYTICNTQTLNK
jgi:hypothetical protein